MSRYNRGSLFSSLKYVGKQRSLDRKPWNRTQQKITDIELTDEFFQNSQGCYRWSNIRSAYHQGFIDINKVVDLYRCWRDQNEYLWLDGFDLNDMYIKTLFVKASKRGNDVFQHRIKKVFGIFNRLDPIHFFTDEDSHKRSSMLFVTLTVDPKKYSLDQSWQQIGEQLHLFETKLRNKYGSFVKLRVWESHESGFPHVHIVYYFHKKQFPVFSHWSKNNKGKSRLTWRIPTVHRDNIKAMWGMGSIVDVQAVQDTLTAFNELTKYVTKTVFNKKGDLTNAMLCLFRKQQYWISKKDPYTSRDNYCSKHHIDNWKDQEKYFQDHLSEWCKKDFIGAIWGMKVYLDLYSHPDSIAWAQPSSNAALVNDTVHNCNDEFPEIVRFVFQGAISQSDLSRFWKKTDDVLSFWGDPPPEIRLLCSVSDVEGFDTEGYPDADLDRSDDIMYCSRCGAMIGSRESVGFGGSCPECLRESMFTKKDPLGDIYEK